MCLYDTFASENNSLEFQRPVSVSLWSRVIFVCTCQRIWDVGSTQMQTTAGVGNRKKNKLIIKNATDGIKKG